MIPKFRAWDKNRKEMCRVVSLDTYICRPSEVTIMDNHCDMHQRIIDDIELMQFTGLKDKNGIGIYEGDIVNITHYFGGHPCGEIKHIIKRSKYNNNLVADSESGDWRKPEVSMSSRNSDDYEIIGNIYENPELFEVEDE